MILLLSSQLLTPPLPAPLHGPWQLTEHVQVVPRFTMVTGMRLSRATSVNGPWEYVGCVVSNQHGLKIEWVESEMGPVEQVRVYKVERPM